jgi:hypothetical protein
MCIDCQVQSPLSSPWPNILLWPGVFQGGFPAERLHPCSPDSYGSDMNSVYGDSEKLVPRSSRGVPRGFRPAILDVHGRKAREERIPSHERRVPPLPDGARGSSSRALSGERAAKGRSGGAKARERLTTSPSRLPRWSSRRSPSPSDGSKVGE